MVKLSWSQKYLKILRANKNNLNTHRLVEIYLYIGFGLLIRFICIYFYQRFVYIYDQIGHIQLHMRPDKNSNESLFDKQSRLQQ